MTDGAVLLLQLLDEALACEDAGRHLAAVAGHRALHLLQRRVDVASGRRGGDDAQLGVVLPVRVSRRDAADGAGRRRGADDVRNAGDGLGRLRTIAQELDGEVVLRAFLHRHVGRLQAVPQDRLLGAGRLGLAVIGLDDAGGLQGVFVEAEAVVVVVPRPLGLADRIAAVVRHLVGAEVVLTVGVVRDVDVLGVELADGRLLLLVGDQPGEERVRGIDLIDGIVLGEVVDGVVTDLIDLGSVERHGGSSKGKG